MGTETDKKKKRVTQYMLREGLCLCRKDRFFLLFNVRESQKMFKSVKNHKKDKCFIWCKNIYTVYIFYFKMYLSIVV